MWFTLNELVSKREVAKTPKAQAALDLKWIKLKTQGTGTKSNPVSMEPNL